MLTNNTITPAGNNPYPSPNVSKGNAMTQDDFMKILLTQMRMQTPENPFDSNTMMQQMAQLTNLSATKEMESAVKNLNTSMASSQVLTASQLVGKKVQIAGNSCPLIPGEGLNGAVILPQDVEQATISITDKSGRVVKTIELGQTASGFADFKWDGLDGEGKPMPPGLYNISASSLVNGTHVANATAGTFKVESVGLDTNSNSVILNLDGLGAVSMKELIKIL